MRMSGENAEGALRMENNSGHIKFRSSGYCGRPLLKRDLRIGEDFLARRKDLYRTQAGMAVERSVCVTARLGRRLQSQTRQPTYKEGLWGTRQTAEAQPEESDAHV